MNKLSFLSAGILCGILLIFLFSCSEERKSEKIRQLSADEQKFYNGIGPGPVTKLKLDNEINATLVTEGERIFQSKCRVCHKLSVERGIGPGLSGVTLRRRPEWIMNQMLNPMEMTQKDSLAKELLKIYLTQMAPMDLSHDDARAVLEFFRKSDFGK